MTNIHRFTVCTILSGFVLYTHFAYAQADQPDPHQTVLADAYGYSDALVEIGAFNRKTQLDAYKHFGVHDPAWDQVAKEFIESWGVYFTYSATHASVYNVEVLDAAKTNFRDRHELRDRLVELDCTDPMVQYLIASTYREEGEDAKAFRYAQLSFIGFKESGYPAFRKYFSALRLIEFADQLRQPSAQLKEMRVYWEKDLKLHAITALTEGTEETSFAVRDRMVTTILEPFLGKTRLRPDVRKNTLKYYLDALGPLEADHAWMYCVARGVLLIDYAWAHRGSGFVHTVSPAQWRDFEKYMVEARKSLERAWRLEPSSLIARKMMTIAMAGHAAEGDDIRVWFERAKDLMFDDATAWSEMLYALRPRWGGSHLEMLDLAVEAVNTGRFDTPIPYYASRILGHIEDERDDALFWSQPKAIDAMDRLCRGLDSAELRDREGDVWYVALRAAYLWKGRAYDKALVALTELGELDAEGQMNLRRAFQRVRGDVVEAKGEIYGYTSDHADQLQGGLKQLERRRFEQAKEILTDLLNKPHLRPEFKQYVSLKLRGVEFQELFAKGEWVKLDDPSNFSMDWEFVRGQWSADEEEGVIGRAEESGLALISRHRVDGPLQIRCDVEVLGPEGHDWANAGAFFHYESTTTFDGCWIFPSTKQVGSMWPNWGVTPPKNHLKTGKNKLEIRQNKQGVIIMFVNGKSAGRFRNNPINSETPFGLGSASRVLGQYRKTPINFDELTARYTNISIKSNRLAD